MKTILTRIPIPALIACLSLMLLHDVTAQTFTTLYNFSALSDSGTNTDGAAPLGLILSCNRLFGIAEGGFWNSGTIFALNTDGTGFSNLYNFSAALRYTNNSVGIVTDTNSDGDEYDPIFQLVLSGSTLYGTAYGGGSSGDGTVFAVKTDGSGFTVLYIFTALGPYFLSNSDGANPAGALILSDNILYGTAYGGGVTGFGTIFGINTDGSSFTNLHDFAQGNNDGAGPVAGVVQSGDTLYGTTSIGGSANAGAVFRMNVNGTAFTNLHSFADVADFGVPNSDGAFPAGGLLLSGDTLYGTALTGGYGGSGTIFSVKINGTDFTNLHHFSALAGSYPPTNSDGANPGAALTLSSGTLYGSAQNGGLSGTGTLFAINTDGTGFTNLHNFTTTSGPRGTNTDGAFPFCSLILTNEIFYGTAFEGGIAGNGTVFSLSFAPQLAIATSGTNIILTWPANIAGFDYAGYILQRATNPVSTSWSSVTPVPTISNGRFAVTNPMSGTQIFYRLSKQVGLH